MKTKSFFAASLLLFGAMVAVSGPTANAMIYNITANVINSSQFFLLCSYDKALKVSSNKVIENSCNDSVIDCEVKVGFDESFVDTLTVDLYEVYYMLVLNCAERSAPYNLSANVVLKNPNGEHLVCGTLPFPTMYTTLVALWVIVALWMLEKILRKPKRTTLVTLAFLLMIVLKITYCVLSMEWWKDISRTGLSPSISLRLLRVLFNAAFEFVFFGTWMVLSSGWAVLRKSFNRTSAITLMTSCLIAVACALETSEIDSYYFGLFILVLHFFLRDISLIYSHTAATQELRNMDVRLVVNEDNEGRVLSPQHLVAERGNAISSLKHLISAWIVFDLGVYLTMHFFTRDWVWTPAIALELMEVIAFICLGIIMRPRKYPVFALERFVPMQDRPAPRSQIQNQKVQQRASEMINQQRSKRKADTSTDK